MRKFLLLPAINLMCAITLHATVFKNDIPNIINTVVNDSTSEIWISNLEYVQGDTIHLWNGFITCPFDEAWAVFIDYKPLHNWAHKCAYLYIDTVTGEYKQFEKTLPPLRISEQWTKYRAFQLHDVDANTSLYPQWLTRRDSLNRSRTQRDSNRTAQDNPHLYAIIIDYCGTSCEYNYERLWNDCAAMYNAFLNNGYARDHIYVAMPDSSSGPDLRLLSGDCIPSPTDLDGDGISDVGYDATTYGLEHLFNDISSHLTEDDILTIYLTGHGNLPPDFGNNYCGILADDNFSDNLLINKISSLDAGICNIIIQRSYINYIYDYDVLSTLYPYAGVISFDPTDYHLEDEPMMNFLIDEYTDRWIFAVNGNDMGTCDINGDGNISMYEAHIYAKYGGSNFSNDSYQKSNPTCLRHDLTLTGTIPNEPCIQSDLYIKDNYGDDGTIPNPSNNFYNSESIWLEDLAGNIVLHPISTIPYNVCVKIRNRGTISSTGDEVLHLHWTKAAIGGKWPDSWIDGSTFDCNGNIVSPGGEITPSEGYSLPVIPAGGVYIARIPWCTPNNTHYTVCSQFEDNIEGLWQYGLLARLYDENETPGEDMVYQPMNTFVRNSNNVAMRNVSLFGLVHYNTIASIVGIMAPYTGMFSLEGKAFSNFEDILNGNVGVKIYLDDNIHANWSGIGNGFMDLGETLQITTPITQIQDIYLEENRLYAIKVEVEVGNGTMPELVYDITLRDTIGRVLGGERFQYIEDEGGVYRSSSARTGHNNTSELDIVSEMQEAKRITVINALGQIMYIDEKSQKPYTKLTDLPYGVYFVIVEYENITKTYKIMR